MTTVDPPAGLTDTGRQPGEIAVAGDQAETGKVPGIQQVHGIDDHRAVGRVLARSVAELLDRLDGMLQQHLLPLIQIGLRPVAVDPLDARHAKLRDLGQQTFNDGRMRVIRVDENRE